MKKTYMEYLLRLYAFIEDKNLSNDDFAKLSISVDFIIKKLSYCKNFNEAKNLLNTYSYHRSVRFINTIKELENTLKELNCNKTKR